MKLTTQQEAIVAAAAGRTNLIVQAGAGTGKTSTLVHVAAALHAQGLRGLYIAFNKAIVEEAKGKFNGIGVYCATAHSLAFRAVVTPVLRVRLKDRMLPWEQAKVLGITSDLAVDDVHLTASSLATLARNTVTRFCHSAARNLHAGHVPHVPGTEEHRDTLVNIVLPAAQRYWNDVIATNGKLPVAHDHYLKVWGLSNPALAYDYLLVDEAQDLNPVLADIVDRQTCQVIKVGDSAQSIYGWRGAIDAMRTDNDAFELYLSKSFRFGPAVADVANLWLDHIDTPLTLEGFEQLPSRVVDYGTFADQPHTILCRTNAGVISAALDAMAKGRKVAVVGGVDALLKLVEAADKLQSGRRTEHPDLMAFPTWHQVITFVDDHGADEPDLKRLVDLVSAHGTKNLLSLLRRTVDEQIAEIVVSTAHKAKGREWPNVRVFDDFREPQPGKDGEPPRIQATEAMLAYVTVTRAQLQLDQGGLAWINDWDGGP